MKGWVGLEIIKLVQPQIIKISVEAASITSETALVRAAISCGACSTLVPAAGSLETPPLLIDQSTLFSSRHGCVVK